MQHYSFTLRNSRNGNEDLGDMPLNDDDEAIAFAGRIIQELMERFANEYRDATIGIAQGKRIVASVPFDFETSGHPRDRDISQTARRTG